MKGMIALLTAIMVILFISDLLKYFHWMNTFTQQFWLVMFCINPLIGTFSHLFCCVTDGIFNICISIFMWHLFWYVYIIHSIYSCLYHNCILCIIYTILYYISGSNLCAAIVQLYRTYSLYYLLLRVNSDLCAVYLYYFVALTQTLRTLAAPTQLVPATVSHRPLPLKSQWWRSCSGAF